MSIDIEVDADVSVSSSTTQELSGSVEESTLPVRRNVWLTLGTDCLIVHGLFASLHTVIDWSLIGDR